MSRLVDVLRSSGDRRLGWVLALAGLGLALAVQVAQPVGVPLYDGVVVQEPYRYLHPTGHQLGDPPSFTSMPAVTGSVSPGFAAATSENPTQAQLIVQDGAFELTAGATALQVSVTPVDPVAPVPEGRAIAGNVYRFVVTDQAGTPLPLTPCSGCATLQLRGPDEIGEATLMRFDGSAWVDVVTNHTPMLGGYGTNVTVLGDYAVVEVVEAGEAFDTRILVLLAAVAVVFVGAVAFLYLRQRREDAQPPPRGTGGRRGGGGPGRPPDRAARIPSKRTRPTAPRKGSC